MAKELPQIQTNVDTFQSWITKTNQVIDAVTNEVITANSTLGVTGTSAAQQNARLFGSFTANTLIAATAFTVGGVSANATHLTVGSRVIANGSIGTAGQVLASNGTGVYWTSGAIGFSGSRGFSGSAGSNGFTGSAGAGFTGSTGSAGSRGFTGSASTVAGSTGFTGSVGSNASVGPPLLRHVTSGFTGGGQVIVSSTTPSGTFVQGDIWIQI